MVILCGSGCVQDESYKPLRNDTYTHKVTEYPSADKAVIQKMWVNVETVMGTK